MFKKLQSHITRPKNQHESQYFVFEQRMTMCLRLSCPLPVIGQLELMWASSANHRSRQLRRRQLVCISRHIAQTTNVVIDILNIIYPFLTHLWSPEVCWWPQCWILFWDHLIHCSVSLLYFSTLTLVTSDPTLGENKFSPLNQWQCLLQMRRTGADQLMLLTPHR